MQTYWLVGPKEAYIEQSNQFQSNNETVDTGILSDFIPRMYEQIFNAMRVQELGAGNLLKKENVTPNILFKIAEEILNTKSYYENAKQIGKTLRNSGGYKKATEEIIEFINQKAPSKNI